MAGDGGRDEGGAAFLEEGDGALSCVGQAVEPVCFLCDVSENCLLHGHRRQRKPGGKEVFGVEAQETGLAGA